MLHVPPPLSLSLLTLLSSDLNPKSFQFLVDVSKFKSSVHAAHQGGNDDYEEFIVIVDEYIKDNSNCEVNIDSRTKKKILGFGERSVYASLGTVKNRCLFYWQLCN